MNEVDQSQVRGRLPVWVVLLALLLLVGGGGWLVWRAQFAQTPRTVTIASAPSEDVAPVQQPVVQPATPAPAVPAPPAGETLQQKLDRLGIRPRRISVTPLPEGVTHNVTIRISSVGIEIGAELRSEGSHDSQLKISYSPMPPGGPSDSEKGQIRRGAELIGMHGDSLAQLKIDNNQFIVLLSSAVPGRSSRLLPTTNPDGSADPLAEHMSAFFEKWKAADRAGKKSIEADWFEAVKKEGPARLAEVDAQTASDFDKSVAALTDEQKKVLIDLAKASPATQPVDRKPNHVLIDGADEKTHVVELDDGVHISDQVIAIAGKLTVAYLISTDAKAFFGLQPRFPTTTRTDWIRTDLWIAELLHNDKLARELAITDAQLAQLRGLPPRPNGGVPVPDADRELITRLLTDYSDCSAADREAKGEALLKGIRELGDRVVDPFMETQKGREVAIEFILTSSQTAQLNALFHDFVVAK